LDKYFTIMVIPEREKGVKSFRLPKIVAKALVFLVFSIVLLIGILIYDYTKVLKQVYENKHLTIENRQLKEQIQLFQMKINNLADDLERIGTFERKLKVITGLDNNEEGKSRVISPLASPITDPEALKRSPQSLDEEAFDRINDAEGIKKEKQFIELKSLYEQEIARSFGLQTGYQFTKEWSDLTKQSFIMASQYATFDFKYSLLKELAKKIEVDIHDLDEYLMDRKSFLTSLPTILPAQGWITSYFGPRISPTSGRLKMHEGLDVGGLVGAPIVAPADGTVTFSGPKPGFGVIVQLDHGYGVETLYAHNNSTSVKKGQHIKRGDQIARVGNTGNSTGPHLHYEIRINGTTVDPLYFILD